MIIIFAEILYFLHVNDVFLLCSSYTKEEQKNIDQFYLLGRNRGTLT